MRSAPMLDFPLDEFEQRLGKLFDTLERTDCAAVLLTNVENLRYYCNFRTSAWNSEFLSPAMLVVARSGGIALVTSPRMKATASTSPTFLPSTASVRRRPPRSLSPPSSPRWRNSAPPPASSAQRSAP